MRYDYGYDAILQQHRESCLRLGLPRVNMLTIHDLDGMFAKEDPNGIERNLGQLLGGGSSWFPSIFGGASSKKCGLDALRELKESKAIDAVGMGCNDYEHNTLMPIRCVLEADVHNVLDYIIIAGPYTLLNQEGLDDLIPMLEKKGCKFVVGAPLCSGILVSKVAGRSAFIFISSCADYPPYAFRLNEK